MLKFFFLVMVVKIGPYYGNFSRIYRSKLSIYLQNYIKNGLIFKTTNQIFFFNTVHNLITFSIVFTNKNRGGGTLSPHPLPPIITKAYLPPIITKVNTLDDLTFSESTPSGTFLVTVVPVSLLKSIQQHFL